jgi:adenylate cyclase
MPTAHDAGAATDNTLVSPTAEEVRTALTRLLASSQFAGAERLRRFLTYVVDRAIDGRADEIKESVLATEVFDRDPSYDPRLDAVVRVEAGRLRSRLAEYYAEAGAAESVVIRVPKGGYAPVFERRAETPGALATAPSAPDAAPEAPVRPGPVVHEPRPRARFVVAGAAVALLAAASAIALSWTRTPSSPETGARPSVAVLPLDGDTDAAGERVTESLSRALVRVGALEVVAHSRVREAAARGDSPSRIAGLFDVDYTVEGRVAGDAGSRLIEVVLVDARAGRKLWVDSFTGARTAPEPLVARVAAAIADAVGRRADR